jgi:hypothetical protein
VTRAGMPGKGSARGERKGRKRSDTGPAFPCPRPRPSVPCLSCSSAGNRRWWKFDGSKTGAAGDAACLRSATIAAGTVIERAPVILIPREQVFGDTPGGEPQKGTKSAKDGNTVTYGLFTRFCVVCAFSRLDWSWGGHGLAWPGRAAERLREGSSPARGATKGHAVRSGRYGPALRSGKVTISQVKRGV